MYELNKLYNAKCENGMKEFPDKYFDLAVVDPPYGINAPKMSMGSNKSRKGDGYPSTSTAERIRKQRLNHGCGKLKDRALNTMNCEWDEERPKPEYFQELFRVSKHQIIWGYNYFSDMLPPCRGVIIWDKCQPWDNFSQAEIAWTSFDRPAAIVRISNTGGKNDEKKIHPTQKPVELYAWIYNRYAKRGMRVIDTHAGSASSLVAAHDAGLEYIGFEKNPDYFLQSEKRLIMHTAQMNLFDFPEVLP